MMRYWTGVAAAFGLGAVVGGLAIRVLVEKEVREDYNEKFASLERTFALRESIKAEPPAESEEELVPSKYESEMDYLKQVADAKSFIQDIDFNEVAVTPLEEEPVKNAYHKAISAVETPVDMFVDGGVNDYGCSYIEEEEYLDDDGRYKGKIDILMDDHNPIFLMDGQEIEDWDRRVGDSILVDFYTHCPPGVEPILYVRNHRTDEDYEVVRVTP